MPKYSFVLGAVRYEVDLDANTLTAFAAGSPADVRPLLPTERTYWQSVVIPGQVQALSASLDQLVLDALMGA
jgi:hypothetical protein